MAYIFHTKNSCCMYRHQLFTPVCSTSRGEILFLLLISSLFALPAPPFVLSAEGDMKEKTRSSLQDFEKNPIHFSAETSPLSLSVSLPDSPLFLPLTSLLPCRLPYLNLCVILKSSESRISQLQVHVGFILVYISTESKTPTPEPRHVHTAIENVCQPLKASEVPTTLLPPKTHGLVFCKDGGRLRRFG